MSYYPTNPAVGSGVYPPNVAPHPPIAVQVDGQYPPPVQVVQGDATPPIRHAYASIRGQQRTYEEPEVAPVKRSSWLFPVAISFGLATFAGTFIGGVIVGGAWYQRQIAIAQGEAQAAQKDLETLQVNVGALCQQIPSHAINPSSTPAPFPSGAPEPAIAAKGKNAPPSQK